MSGTLFPYSIITTIRVDSYYFERSLILKSDASAHTFGYFRMAAENEVTHFVKFFFDTSIESPLSLVHDEVSILG